MYLGRHVPDFRSLKAPDGATKLARTAKSHQAGTRCNTFGARFVTEIGRPAPAVFFWVPGGQIWEHSVDGRNPAPPKGWLKTYK